MFWYRQLPGQSLTLIATANQGSEATYESGFTKDKFPISRPNLTFSILTVSSVNPEDSSFYFCSAGDTVPGTDQRSEQELQLPPAHLSPPQFPSRWALLKQAGGRKPQLSSRDRCLSVCGQVWVWMCSLRWRENFIGLARGPYPQTRKVTTGRLKINSFRRALKKCSSEQSNIVCLQVTSSETPFNYFISMLYLLIVCSLSV